jgi:mannose/cellobiose epimerase-like protein (N-acyl-D-glucosamine 2-epimerase family)
MTGSKTMDLVSWMRSEALPLWAERGWDKQYGGFVEELDPNGNPSDVPFKRVRVQGRQLFSFSTAALRGWHPQAASLADQGFDYLKTHCKNKDGVWARRLNRDGSILDPEMDLYDTSFVVLGLTAYYRLTRNAEALSLIENTLPMVWANLSAVPGGYYQSKSDKDHLRQNPHMHWFECMILAFEATGDRRYLKEAGTLYTLARDAVIDGKSGALRELFNKRWKPVREGWRILVEPGHHYEWAWLLARAGKHMDVDPALGPKICGFADRFGVDPGTGLVFDQVSAGGKVTQATHRLWVQTEALKAWMVRSDVGEEARQTRIGQLEAAVLRHYFDRDPRGSWGDRLEAGGKLMPGPSPASSFYHILMCVAELADWRASKT